MLRVNIKRLIIICLLLLISGIAFNVQSSPPKKATFQDNQTTSIKASEEDQKAALQQWTREARLAAKPLPFPEGSTDEIGPQDDEEVAIGEGTSIEGGKPDAAAQQAAQQQFPEEWKLIADKSAVQDAPAPAGSEGVYTSYLGNYYTPMMHTYFPYQATGKLYITGGGYCSASVVSSHNIIVTAAHCLYNTDTNQWYNGWVFVPADRAGAAPYGTFPWASARVLPAWMNAANSLAGRRYDVAVITLANNSVGRPVTYYTGWLGRAWNWGYIQHLHASGYPSNLNTGRYTYLCAAESFYQGADILGMGCNMMHGSSGGPWLIAFTPYAYSGNYVDSVVSGGLSGSTWGNTFYGARFSDNNIVPLCNAEGC